MLASFFEYIISRSVEQYLRIIVYSYSSYQSDQMVIWNMDVGFSIIMTDTILKSCMILLASSILGFSNNNHSRIAIIHDLRSNK